MAAQGRRDASQVHQRNQLPCLQQTATVVAQLSHFLMVTLPDRRAMRWQKFVDSSTVC
jgi:hypothetical protein